MAHSPQHAIPSTTFPDADYRKVIRRGALVMLLGFGGFLAWALFAPVDEGVPANGVIAVESRRKRIDHLNGGIVQVIHVREGQKVREGDPLFTLNDAQARAALRAAQSQWRVAAVTAARLDAERRGATALQLPDEISGAAQDAELAPLIQAQSELLRSRRNALQGELAIIRESVRGLDNQIASMHELVAGRAQQIKLFNEQLAAYNKLFKQNFVARTQLITIEQQLAEVQTRQSEDLANTAAVKARLSEFRMRGAQRELEYRREIESQLAETQKEKAVAQERLAAARDVFERLVLRAPVAGSVVDLALFTVGGVVKAGDKLMEIVPDGDELLVEGQVAPQYIDRIRVGLPADIHFDAFVNQVKQPVITGKVKTLSADALVEARTGSSYYSVRVAVAGAELAKLGAFKVQPGMQTTVMVKTGERSMMTYLLRPLFRRFATAMREN
jgi:protease secretion system membrane fusion protein